MKIPVKWTTKSIDKAIKEVERYRKHLVNLIPKFLDRCADRVIEIANQKIELFDFDNQIISGIQNGWQKTKGNNTLLLENTNEKAVYIEFGVGQVGATSKHKNASDAGYEYDINNHGQEGWGFYLDADDGVDILSGLYQDEYVGGNRLHIYTKGSPATMFCFNAIMDFIDNKEFVPIMKDLLKGL